MQVGMGPISIKFWLEFIHDAYYDKKMYNNYPFVRHRLNIF